MKTAATYARVSTHAQFSKNNSIPSQISICQNYADRHNLEVLEVYTDDISATSDRRPGFQRLIKDAEEKKFQVILVDQMDRFARNRGDAIYYKARLKKYKVELIFVSDNLISGDDDDFLREAFSEVLGEYYSKDLAKKVRRGQIQALKNNYHPCGNPPLGYLSIPTGTHKKLIPDPVKASIIKELFTLAAAGKTMAELMNFMNASLPPLKASSWNDSAIRFVLNNRTYLGERSYGKIIQENAHEPIISKELFDQARAARRSRVGKPTRNKRNYLLAGAAFCSSCGGRLIGKVKNIVKSKRYCYYICINYSQKKTCSPKGINIEILEAEIKRIVSEFLEAAIVKKKNAPAGDMKKQHEREIKGIEKELLRVKREKENIVNAIVSGMSPELFREKSEALAKEEGELTDFLKKRKAEGEKILTVPRKREEILKLKEFLEVAKPEALKAFYKSFVRVSVDLKNRAGSVEFLSNPRGLFPLWEFSLSPKKQ